MPYIPMSFIPVSSILTESIYEKMKLISTVEYIRKAILRNLRFCLCNIFRDWVSYKEECI